VPAARHLPPGFTVKAQNAKIDFEPTVHPSVNLKLHGIVGQCFLWAALSDTVFALIKTVRGSQAGKGVGIICRSYRRPCAPARAPRRGAIPQGAVIDRGCRTCPVALALSSGLAVFDDLLPSLHQAGGSVSLKSDSEN
jgi:hypothetical protein